nr:MAG TPA: hypothetical protein [Caudoviricetes sp.]
MGVSIPPVSDWISTIYKRIGRTALRGLVFPFR